MSVLPNIRALEHPVTDDQLRPLDPSEVRIQFTRLPSEAQLARVNALLEDRPDVELRVYYGHDGTIPDLEFLRHLPALRRFTVDNLFDRLSSFDGLRHVPHLESLGIGATSRPMSLAPLRHLMGLRRLYVEGPHRDDEVIGELEGLEDLTLRSVTLPDLSILLPLRRLQSLDLKLGGTRHIGLLPRIGRLEYVELWLIRGLDDVSPVAEVETLRHLMLQALRQVTRLPPFARSTALRRVDLETMKGLTDLSPLAEAPNLEILNLIDMRYADPEILRPFIGHPSLRAGIWGFGSKRKNFAAQDLLPLPPEPYRYGLERRGDDAAPGGVPWDAPDWTGFRSADRG